MLLFVLWLVAASHEPKPSVELRVMPIIAFAPARVTATVVIQNGGERLYCPEIKWEWAEGVSSLETSDCDPYSEATASKGPQTFSRSMVYGAGEHEIRVTLSRSGHVLRVLTRTVDIREGIGG